MTKMDKNASSRHKVLKSADRESNIDFLYNSIHKFFVISFSALKT